MKFISGAVVTGLVIIGLAIALVIAKKQADNLHARNTASIFDFSNQLDIAYNRLNDLQQGDLKLTNDLATAGQALEAVSNQLTETSGELAGVKTENEGVQGHVTTLTGRVGELEPRNRQLDERVNSLSNNIISLNAQLAETRRMLAVSKTNSAVLAERLQMQMARKAQLERQFNDINQVRAQASYLSFGYY